MRPLVVLLLVLGSLAALVFALTALTDSGRSGEDGRGTAVEPVRPRVDRPAELTPAERVGETTGSEAHATPETRQAVVPDADPGGRSVAFGAIQGLVVDPEGQPIAGAEVGLLNARPSALGDDYWTLRGIDPPRPVSKVKTEADGAFRFDQLDPRKDWSLTVVHEKYLSHATDQTIPVPEGGTWLETIRLEPGQVASGFVRDAKTSQPIAGALLVVDGPFAGLRRSKSPSRAEAVTDATGAYTFSNVGGGSQSRVLTITAPGYATQVISNFTMVVQGEAPRRFKNKQPEAKLEGRKQDFELEPGMIIAGRVVDPSRRGVPGIEIEALSQSGTLNSTGLARSGPQGEFLLEGLAEGIYTLRVTAGHYDAHPLQRVEAGKTDVLVELFEQATVTGKVVDPRGQPVASFVVKARAANEISKAYGAVVAEGKVRGSSDGSFELRGVPEGSYVIEGLAEGFASSFSDTISATQGLVTSDVLVRMTEGGSLTGLVLESYGNAPVVGAEVSTLDNDYMEDGIWEMFGAMEPSATTKTKAYTDAAGRFQIDLVTPGPYQIKIKAKGFSPFSVKDVQVVEGQTTEVPTQVLIKGASISGIVYGAGKQPQPGASVQLGPADQGFEGVRKTRADGNGHYLIDNVRPGTYELSATRPSSSTGNPFEAISDMKQSQVQVSVDDGKQYDVDLHLAGASRD